MRSRSSNRSDPKLIELRRQNAQRLEQNRQQLAAQNNTDASAEQKKPLPPRRENPKLIELRRQNALRLEQSRRQLVAQQNAQKPPGGNPNKCIRFPRNTFP